MKKKKSFPSPITILMFVIVFHINAEKFIDGEIRNLYPFTKCSGKPILRFYFTYYRVLFIFNKFLPVALSEHTLVTIHQNVKSC